MLVLLRGLRETDNFLLATNVKDADKFDDLIFKYNTDLGEDKSTKTIFVQLKHKGDITRDAINMDNLLAERGPYSVPKYFNSYLKIKKQFSNLKSGIFEGDFGKCEFLIYTNNRLHSSINNDQSVLKINCNEMETGKLLGSSNGHVVMLNENKQIVDKLCSGARVGNLCKEIYNYALGSRRDKEIRADNKTAKEHEIFLANHVFNLARNNEGKMAFRDKFVDSNVEKDTKNFWNDLFLIYCKNHSPDVTKFQESLKDANMKVYKSFGNALLKMKHKEVEDLAKKLVKVMKDYKSPNIKINKEILPEGINELANNVMVYAEIIDGNEWVKFADVTTQGNAGKFLKIVENLTAAEKQTDISKYRFCISGFPRFTLPKRGDDGFTENDVADFLKRFKIFACQLKERELDEIMIREIGETYHEKLDNSKMIYLRVRDLVEKCWKDKKPFTKKDQLFIDAANQNRLNRMNIEKFDVHFNKSGIVKWVELINKHQVINIVADRGAKFLSLIRVIQVVNSDDKWKFENNTSILISLDQLKGPEEHILKAYASKDLLVVEVNCKDEFDIALQQLSAMINRNTGMKVILISEADLGKHCEKYFRLHIEQDKNIFKDLTSESQTMILHKNVPFQGKPMKLNELIDLRDAQTHNIIGSQTVMQLMNEKYLVICNEPQRLCDLEAAKAILYTPITIDAFRTFLIERLDGKSLVMIFGVSDDGLLQLVGTETVLFKKQIKYKIIQTFPIANNDILREFKNVCVTNMHKIVYCIVFQSGQIILQQIYDPQFYTKRSLYHPGKTTIRMDFLLQEDVNDNIIIDCETGIPGMRNLHQIWKGDYLRKFDEACENGKIIFETNHEEASNTFNKLVQSCNSVIWLELDYRNQNKLQLLVTHGPMHTLNTDQRSVAPDILVNGTQLDTTFIVQTADKEKMKDMLIRCLDNKLQCFENSLEKSNIEFENSENDEESTVLQPSKSNKSTHWLKSDAIDAHNLVWVHSNASLEGLHSYVSNTCDEEWFGRNVDDKCVILADEPGMGKSTTLTSLTGQMLEKYWVIRVDFRECEESINKLPSHTEKHVTFQDVVDFFCIIGSTGMQSELSKAIFLHKLQQITPQNREIMILMDAYDEISDELQRKVIFLMKFLKDNTSAKVWVTTRLTKVQELEKALATFATRFESFDILHQVEFLHNFWIVRLNLLVESKSLIRLEQYTEQLLVKSRKFLGQGIFQLMGIPLQLRLLAEGFKNEALQFCQTANESLDLKELNLINMYRHFIDEKFTIYFTYKVHVEGLPEDRLDGMKKTDNENYRYLALKVLFPDEDELHTNYDPPTEKGESALKSVGIIQSFGSEGNTYFIHRTFAEYFAADFLSSNLNKHPSRQTTMQFLMKEIFKPSNIVISRFLDQMLSANSINMAVLEGDLPKLLKCFKGNNSEQFIDSLERTALHLAARDGHETIVKVLLENGYDAFKQDAFGKTCLHYATMNRDEYIVEHLLDYTSDIDIVSALPNKDDLLTCDPNRKCIFLNSEHLSSNIVKLVNEKDLNGISSLRASVNEKHYGISRLLVKFGAEVSCVNEEERKAMLEAEKSWIRYREVGRFLMRNNGQPESRDSNEDEDEDDDDDDDNNEDEDDDDEVEDTRQPLLQAADRHDLEEVKKLLSNGVDVNVTDKCNKTALDYAITGIIFDYNNILEIANTVAYLLIDCKGESNLTDAESRIATKIMKTRDHTLLHEATTLPTTFFAAYLIHLGADVNMRDKDGRTPLHRAALHFLTFHELFPKNEMILYLLENGAKHDAVDIYNKTVLDYIQDKRDTEVFLLISDIDKVFKNPSASRLVISNLRFIMQYYNAINGHTLIHVAVTKNDRALLSQFNTDDGIYQINEEDNQGNAPLHSAASIGWIEGVNLLLKYGAHFNSTNRKNETAKQIAENTNKEEIVEKLQAIQNIFDVVAANNTDDIKTFLNSIKSKQSDDFFLTVINSRDTEGSTPLHLAAKANNFQIVHFLLKIGASYDAVNRWEAFDHVTNDQEIKELFEVVQSVLDSKGKIDYKPINENLNPLCFLNARNRKWETFLHNAAFCNYQNYYRINYFIKNGADINAIDKNGRTVLERAIPYNLDFVKLLLTNGVNISNLTDDKLKRLKDEAKSEGREDILAMLP